MKILPDLGKTAMRKRWIALILLFFIEIEPTTKD